MKERPILFSAPMVRALLAGTKTQTRRAADQLLADRIDHCPGFLESLEGLPSKRYGQPGDRLWVRETWALHPDYVGRAIYRADPGCEYDVDRWSPSIHMPRWASRITLEVTCVRVERLQDISEADAIAEGVRQMRDGSGCWVGREGPANLVTPWLTARDAFRDLWDNINGDGSWDTNPWVWAIEFRRLP